MAATPFLVNLYYRTGALHMSDEFATAHRLPFVAAHAFSTSTLTELSHFLAASEKPAVLPSPAVGTRIAFRLVHVNDGGAGDDGSRAGRSSRPPRIAIRDLGSVVIGSGGPGAPTSPSMLEALDDYDIEGLEFDALSGKAEKADGHQNDSYDKDGRIDRNDRNDSHDRIDNNRIDRADRNETKTLADVHFAPGDCISCAIMPPLSNGCVVPAGDIRSGRGSGIGEASIISVRPPPEPRKRTDGAGSRYVPEKDYRAGKWRRGDVSRGGDNGRGGEWRRGDAPTEADVWLRDGGRTGAAGGNANGGGGAGWPGSRRRRNGR